jgi:hypothetical protein
VFKSDELFNIINGKSEIDIKDWDENTIYDVPYCREYYVRLLIKINLNKVD